MAQAKRGRADSRTKPAHLKKPTTLSEQRAAFLEVLSATGNVVRACETSGYPRRTAYDARGADQGFAKLWDQAKELGTEALEDEANRRAREGVSKPVYQGKELVGHVQEFSDTLLIFLLKGLKPEKYRERISTELTGKDGAAIRIIGGLPDTE